MRRTKTPLHVYVPFWLYDNIRQICESQGLKMSRFVSEILEGWAKTAKVTEELSYEPLKRQYRHAVRDFRKYKKLMQKVDPDAEMQNLALKLGLDTESLSNVDEVIAKLLAESNHIDERLHFFIDYLEAAKHMVDVGRKLTEMRKKRYLSSGGVGDAEARPDTHPVRASEGVSQVWEHEADDDSRPEVSM
ncbi:MAG: hypothetical protein QXL06_06470 [Nitrososphaerota archaeon]